MNTELQLICRILDDDIDAWHRFIDVYTPYMKATIHRYSEDEDLAADLYVSLLAKLREGKLAVFSGRSTLPTWLVAVTINHCRDYFRSLKGTKHILTALRDLSAPTRRVFKLFYLQRLPLQAVYEAMRVEAGPAFSYPDLLESMERIRKRVTERKLGKILDRLLRPEVYGTGSERRAVTADSPPTHLLLSYSPLPDRNLERKDFRATLRILREALGRLSPEDRLLLKLRFEHRENARHIRDLLGLSSEKKVYRRVDRALSKLKNMLLETGIPQEVYEYLVHRIDELH